MTEHNSPESANQPLSDAEQFFKDLNSIDPAVRPMIQDPETFIADELIRDYGIDPSEAEILTTKAQEAASLELAEASQKESAAEADKTTVQGFWSRIFKISK